MRISGMIGRFPATGILAGWVVISVVGCRLSAPKPRIDEALHRSGDLSVGREQVRLQMRGLVDPACGVIEEAADAIIAASTDPAVRRAALDWKMEAVPAVREALFQPDPFTAIGDFWVLCFQMIDYFETGPGAAALGEQSAIALTACRELEHRVSDAAVRVTKSGDVSKVRGFLRDWAAGHPIRSSVAHRESTLSRSIDRELSDVFTAGQAVVTMTATVDDLNRRLEVYSDQLPRQVEWGAERLLGDLSRDLALPDLMPLAERAVLAAERAVVQVEGVTPAVERAVRVGEEAPAVIAMERRAMVEALAAELDRTIRFVQEERIAALQYLTEERTQVVGELRESIALEREALSRELEAVGFALVDRVFLRTVQLLAGLLVLLVLALALVAAFLRISGVRRPATDRNPSGVH